MRKRKKLSKAKRKETTIHIKTRPKSPKKVQMNMVDESIVFKKDINAQRIPDLIHMPSRIKEL